MSVRDLVMVSAGEILLALTFGLGLLVGTAMQKRKEPWNGNGNG